MMEYNVIYQNQLPSVQQIKTDLGPLFKNLLLIVDKKVKVKDLQKWMGHFSHIYRVSGGENLKNLEAFPKHVVRLQKLLAGVPHASLAVVTLGGGSVEDFAGFFASVFKRGLPVVHIPSTFLAAVDSAHGGKNGLNVSGSKNQLGTFLQARLIYVVREVLANLPKQLCHSALGEFVKMGFLTNNGLLSELSLIPAWNFEELWRLLPLAIDEKYRIVARDPFEKKGERQILNLGHTLGHVLEAYYGLPHGEAVFFGLDFAIRWSQHRDFLKNEEADRAIKLLNEKFKIQTVNHFVAKRKRIPAGKAKSLLLSDKKLATEQGVRFVFLDQIGLARRVVVPVQSMVTEMQRQGWVLT